MFVLLVQLNTHRELSVTSANIWWKSAKTRQDTGAGELGPNLVAPTVTENVTLSPGTRFSLFHVLSTVRQNTRGPPRPT
jgi:hypothetical protein